MSFVGTVVDHFVGRYQDRLGIARTRRVAKFYNGIRYGHVQRRAIKAYRDRRNELLRENDATFAGTPRNIMHDGWVMDRSGHLHFLEETLREADRLVEERGGIDRRGTPLAQKDYLFHLNDVADLHDYPGLLEFPMSSEVIATVAEYMGLIPVLSLTRHKGVRLFESSDRFHNPDAEFDDSQLFHLDIHDMPPVYVIVLVRDVSHENGPWCFLPTSVSDQAVRALHYQARGEPYRVTDERRYRVIDPAHRIDFTGKRGDVLFLDSSRCFHYGSRKAVQPGYRLMYAFTTHCRSDFTRMLFRWEYPVRAEDSRLRRMVLGAT